MKPLWLILSLVCSLAHGLLQRSSSSPAAGAIVTGHFQDVNLPSATVTRLDALKGTLSIEGDGYAEVIDWLLANAKASPPIAVERVDTKAAHAETRPTMTPAVIHGSQTALTGNVATSNASSALHAKKDAASKQACLFDDLMFGMNSQMKVALQKELTSGPLADAVQYVRSHPNEGWMHCAGHGQPCACTGQVRFLEWTWLGPSTSAPIAVSQSVICDPAQFNFKLTVQNAALTCQCTWDSEKHHQASIQLRFNSWSYAQEAWIFLLRTLGHAKWLPMTGDKFFHGSSLFGARGGGIFDRVWINKWLSTIGQTYVRNYFGGKKLNCMEWDPLFYTHQYFPSCAQSTYNLWYKADPAEMRVEGTTIYADILKLPQVAGALKMDLVVATQVWEHLSQPVPSVKALHDSMNPGGVLLFAVPFKAPFHGAPEDYWRYTKSGVVEVLEQGGFCVPRSAMASGGDFIVSIGLNAGISAGDFSQEELLASYALGFDNIPDGPLEVFAVGVKKHAPTDACPP